MSHPNQEHGLHLPSPTAWPIVLALGVALLLTGMVTSVVVSILGVLLAFLASVGWFRQVLPEEAHQPVEVHAEPVPVVTSRRLAAKLPEDITSRKILPVETFRITTGIRGWLAGGALRLGQVPQHMVCHESAGRGRVCQLDWSQQRFSE